jgi:hypothetical protein
MQPFEVFDIALTGAVGFLLIIGSVALINPRLFERLARAGSRWIDTSRWFAKMECSVDIDKFVLRHARWFGLAVLVGTTALWFLAR